MNPLRQTIWSFYLFLFLNRFAYKLIIVIYYPYLLDDLGLSRSDVAFINSWTFLAMFLFEIPSGIIADRWGRKKSFFLASLLFTSALILYLVGKHFPGNSGYVSAEILAALALTLWSGTVQSWLVNRLNHFNCQQSLLSIFTRATQLELLAGILGAITGGYLYFFKNLHSFSWILAAGIFFLNGVLALFLMKEDVSPSPALPEPALTTSNLSSPRQPAVSTFSATLSTVFRRGLAQLHRYQNVTFVLGILFLICFAEQGPNTQWYSYFSDFIPKLSGFVFSQLESITGSAVLTPLQVKKLTTPIINIQIDLVMIGSAQVAYFLGKLRQDKLVLIFTTLVMAFALILCSLSHSLLPGLSFFLLFNLFRGVINPVKDAILNQEISSTSRYRATILSLFSMFFSLAGWLGLLLCGYLSDHNVSLSHAWLLAGKVLAISTILLILLNRTFQKVFHLFQRRNSADSTNSPNLQTSGD